jgi:hypothetical protein
MTYRDNIVTISGVLRIYSGGGEQFQLKTEGRQNGDLEAVAP